VPALGKRVLVLGGGNVAIDCARSAVRLGCEVHLACLEAARICPPMPGRSRRLKPRGQVYPERTFERILGDGQGARERCRMPCRWKASSFDERAPARRENPPSNHTSSPATRSSSRSGSAPVWRSSRGCRCGHDRAPDDCHQSQYLGHHPPRGLRRRRLRIRHGLSSSKQSTAATPPPSR
jgi:hypothetical protein